MHVFWLNVTAIRLFPDQLLAEFYSQTIVLKLFFVENTKYAYAKEDLQANTQRTCVRVKCVYLCMAVCTRFQRLACSVYTIQATKYGPK